MSEAVALIFGTILGSIWGCVITYDAFTDRLIEAELAEFVVDSTTGDTTFIIYAEDLTTTDK